MKITREKSDGIDLIYVYLNSGENNKVKITKRKDANLLFDKNNNIIGIEIHEIEEECLLSEYKKNYNEGKLTIKLEIDNSNKIEHFACYADYSNTNKIIGFELVIEYECEKYYRKRI
mgnify:CR=1 FL=1